MKPIVYLVIFGLFPFLSLSQNFTPNYDEENVPEYVLPDPLIFDNGKPVKNKKDWAKRRNEIYNYFETEVYGKAPEWHGEIKPSVISYNKNALGGIAAFKQIRLELINKDKKLPLLLLLYVPNNIKDAPLFLGYNFNGNHTISNNPEIPVTKQWVRNKKDIGANDNIANEAGRGKNISRWPIKEIVSRGFGLATLYYGDVDPDYDDGYKNGVHQLYNDPRDSSSWSSISAWAWGLSRVMDYLETVDEINIKKVIVMGLSRLGKTALWAGATDQRYAMVISNNSGCMGAALSRRAFGETVEWYNGYNPHWSCDNFKKYSGKEGLLPIDQHQLLALIAPRPVYVASASNDLWADPKGEFLSCTHASPVYELLGMKGFQCKKMPQENEPIWGGISYHIRTGEHDITSYDWECYMNFAEKYFKTNF